MYTFLHAADLHIDSPLRGLPNYGGAPVEEIRSATRRAFVNLVDLALSEQVAFVLIAGDLYDGDWRDYNTGLFFFAQMVRLRDADIPVFLVSGNHDAASQISKSLRLPENVQAFSSRKPETKVLESLGVAIHGQSFATRDVPEDLAAAYPPPLNDMLNIGLLHTSATGRYGHDPYAPCSLETLTTKGYAYWALGHVHNRIVLHEEPWIVFSGNTQGRHVRETGAKGCTLVRVVERQISTVEHYDLDVLRWKILEVPLESLPDMHAVLDSVRQTLQECVGGIDRLHAVRIHLTGSTQAHGILHADHAYLTNEICALATDIGNGMLWVEEVRLLTSAPHALSITTNDAVGELLRSIETWAEDEAHVAALADIFQDLALKLPHEFRAGADGLDPLDPAVIKALLEEVGDVLQTGWNTPGGVA